MKLINKTKAVELTTVTTSHNKRSEHSNYTNNPSKFKRKFDRNLLPSSESYYRSQFPNLKIINNQAQVKCPFHDDHNPSLSIKFPDGCFYCHACEIKGADILDFQRQRYKQSFEEAVTELNTWKRETHLDKTTIERAKQAAVKYWEIKNLIDKGWIMSLYPYQYADGSFCYVVVRLDPPAGSTEEKWIRPFYFNGKELILGKPEFPDKKPIYSLPKIASNSDDYVWVVEGERCADALISLGLIATTSGSANSAGNADWSPLRNKKAIIWLDKDPPGLKYAQAVTKTLMSLNCSVQWIDINKLDLPPKGDCIDFLALNPDATAETIKNLPLISPQLSQEKDSANFESDFNNKEVNSSDDSDTEIWDKPILFDEIDTPEISADLLPSILRDFARSLAHSTETPESLSVMVILAIISSIASRKYVISPKYGWSETTNIYVIVGLPPANNKSSVFKSCVTPLHDWENKQKEQLEPEIKRQRSEYKTRERRIEHLRSQAAKENIQQKREHLNNEINEEEMALIEPQILPELIVTDITPEELSTKVHDQKNYLGIFSDEGGITEVLAGLYTGGVANIDILLKGIDGGHVKIRRKNKNINLNLVLTIALTVQSTIIQKMGEKNAYSGNGFLERFLYLLPKSNLGYRTHNTPSIPREVFNNYYKLIENMLRSIVEQPTSKKDILSLSPGALKAWREFQQFIEQNLRPNGTFCNLQGWQVSFVDLLYA